MRARGMWPGPPLETVEDLYRVEVDLGDGGPSYTVDTHLFGGPVRVIPYADGDGVRDASGDVVERGDQELAPWVPPGDVAIVVRHHRSSHRKVSFAHERATLEPELGLRNTHVEIAVGVWRDGRAGVVTVNSPPGYAGGRFGTASYPMIFLGLRFPEGHLPGTSPALRSLYDQMATLGQLAFYALAVAGLRWRRLDRWRVLTLPSYFCMVNAACVLATLNVVRGRRIDRWEPQRASTAAIPKGLADPAQARSPRS